MSGGKFITNKDLLLSEIINNILPTTDKLHFLVGFFYFSGFKEVYKQLKDKKIRILVGMDVEIDIINGVKEVLKIEKKNEKLTKANFIGQLKDVFNNSDLYDNEDSIQAIEIFIEKIINHSLEIRKTLYPNHSKLYLFEKQTDLSEGGRYPGVLITGSSNFTFSGLTGRYEFNTEFRDKQVFEEGMEIFNELWESSLPLTVGGEEDEIVKMFKNETWLNIPRPYYCYIRLLSEYFNLDNVPLKTPSEITHGAFIDLMYQVDAIKRGLKIIDEHNGVIIADVVGLGKSIIGSTLLHNLKEKSIIITPPHLKDQWEDYSEVFNYRTKIFSSGKIKEALDYDIKSVHKCGVVLIDEAHKYRNNETNDYGYLHQLCQGKKVILLSATPFNNAPDDVFNLIKLFQIPKKSTIQTSTNLMYSFKKLQKQYQDLKAEQKDNKISEEEVRIKGKKIADKIRDLIGPVVVRRSRIDLDKISEYKSDLKKQGYEFSNVKDPETLNYPLGEINDIYIETLTKLTELDNNGVPKNFKGARYMPFLYIKNISKYEDKIDEVLGYSMSLLEGRQGNMPFFIRRLLVSRFESSIYAFKETLNKLIISIENIENYYKKYKLIPIIKKGVLPDVDDIKDIEGDEFEVEGVIENIKEYIDSKNGFSIDAFDINEGFFNDLKKDKEFLLDLKSKWSSYKIDPKIISFKEEIKNRLIENPNRKVVIFSQYKDTVEYIYKQLSEEFRTLSVTGSSKTQQLKNDIKFNFDAGISKDIQKDDYDVLVATDSISEGYNLHRAGIIYNYDIPYNPTRVIQRVGRINRINKKVFDDLYIYNYFPSFVGEKEVRTKAISTLKLSMIQAILGDDTKILTSDEELSSFYKKIMKDEEQEQGQISWDTKYLNLLKELYANNPEILDKAQLLPNRTRCKRSVDKGKKGVIVFGKKGNNPIFKIIEDGKIDVEVITNEDAFKLFEADNSENPLVPSKGFYSKYNTIKKSLFSISSEVEIDRSEKEIIEKVNEIYSATGDSYFELILEAIELGNFPKVYVRLIREINKNNHKTKIPYVKSIISEQYLQNIISKSKGFDEQSEEVIIAEEF